MPRCPNGTRRSKKTGNCEPKGSRSKTAKRSPVASRKTISDKELDEIIQSIPLDEPKRAQLESMRPKLKQMKFSKSYKSCFTGNPTKNLEAMIQDKIFCWSKYGDAM